MKNFQFSKFCVLFAICDHTSIESDYNYLIQNIYFSVPPSSVKISAPENAKVGDIISISCVAENSNPAADVSLVVNGLTPPGIASSRRKSGTGGFTTVTNLTQFEIQPMDEDLMVYCYAHNQPLSSTKVDTKTVLVLRECHGNFPTQKAKMESFWPKKLSHWRSKNSTRDSE